MGKHPANLVPDLLVTPILVAAPNERGLVPTAGPVKPTGRPPPLLRRHPSVDGELFGAGLFVGQHAGTLFEFSPLGKLFTFAITSPSKCPLAYLHCGHCWVYRSFPRIAIFRPNGCETYLRILVITPSRLAPD